MRVGYDATSYPLSWPAHQKRTQHPQPSRFYSTKREYSKDRQRSWRLQTDRSVYDALVALDRELERLGARYVTVSTNLECRLDGRPRSGQTQPADRGVAVYFMMGEEPRVFACDRWDRVADNIYAIGKTIEALRGIDRWGVGQEKQAFGGYVAIEANAGGDPWWKLLGLESHRASEQQIDHAFKRKARKYHPDGSAPDPEVWRQLAEARRQGLASVEP